MALQSPHENTETDFYVLDPPCELTGPTTGQMKLDGSHDLFLKLRFTVAAKIACPKIFLMFFSKFIKFLTSVITSS